MKFRRIACLLPLVSLAQLATAETEYLPGINWPEPLVVTPGERDADPPSDAVVLFDGTSKSAFTGAEKWTIEGGVLIAGQGNIITRESFGDCQLHIEWSAATPVTGSGQSRSNSGVYFMWADNFSGYEVQILDSYDNPTYFDGQAGAVYKQQPPMVNAMRKPGDWNSFDIFFTAPRINEDGSLQSPAYVTVMHNGVLIQNHVELAGQTAWHKPPEYVPHPDRLPILLQDHGNPVRFRNIWVRDFKKLEGRRVAEDASFRALPIRELKDKVLGGWAGKMIGVAYGCPTEFRATGEINESDISWDPEQVGEAIDQDDLYVGISLAETMDRLGLDATTADYGEAFKHTEFRLWHANAAARRALNFGVKSPASGTPKHNIHANDIDFQIEADFIGLMCPGLPQTSNNLCERVGRVMNCGDGLYGGMFVSGMYTAAYFEQDPEAVVRQGLACLPAESQYAQLIADVLRWWREHPQDWRHTWRLIEEKWDKNDSCIRGASSPYNIDAKINGGYVALGLLYGQRDFGKTIEISTRAGQDSDCNPSTAAGILGVMVGYEQIPRKWKSGIDAIANQRFAFTNSSLNDVCESTLKRARLAVERAGGSMDETSLRIPHQAPTPAALEQWSMGIPQHHVYVDDDALAWRGDWRRIVTEYRVFMESDKAGDKVSLTFSGSAIAVGGLCFEGGGRADVFLDGEHAGILESYARPVTFDNCMWHTYGLEDKEHQLRIVVRGESDERATGAAIKIDAIIPFHASESQDHPQNAEK